MTHVFVDESQRSEYLLCAAVVAPNVLDPTRRAMRALLQAGQRRLHFVDESDGRRRAILAGIRALDLRARIYACKADESDARPALMTALVADLPRDARRLVVESRSERDRLDRRLLVELHKAGRLPDGLEYDFLPPHAEPLLWVPDAVAWAYGAGGRWRPHVDPIIDAVRIVGRS